MINYYLLMKPGIILGNLFTMAAGFLLASKGSLEISLFFETLLGLAFIMASGCVFNNYIDQPLDKKMERTKDRALVKGLISGMNALIFGTFLLIAGNLVLYFTTNLWALLIADFGFFVYVILYSLWKGHTVYGTLIGAIAGAVPPVVGYVAVTHQVDLAAFILFLIMTLWQMPHFFAIALYRLKDYAAAGLPVLPLEKGILRTKIHMALYIGGFIVAASLLSLFRYTGLFYLALVTLAGLVWLALALKGFNVANNEDWGRQMFGFSLVVIAVFCLIIPFDLVTSY